MSKKIVVALCAGLVSVGCALSQEEGSRPTLTASYRASEGFLFSEEELIAARGTLARGELRVDVDGLVVSLASHVDQLALPVTDGDRLPVYSRAAGPEPIAYLLVTIDASGPIDEELGTRDSEVWRMLSEARAQSVPTDISPAAACTNGTWSWRWTGYCDSVCFECAPAGGRGGRNLRDRKYYCAYGTWYATNVYRCRRQCSLCTR